jgi:hypothetical protein
MPDAPEYLVVEFTCARCELTRKKVEVRFRRPDEDIREWMEYVGGVVSRCHAAARPHCRAKAIKEMRIPFTKGQLVGTRPAPPADPTPPADPAAPRDSSS